MEAIKLWQIDGDAVMTLEASNQMESEGLLEDILVKNPRLLEDGLTLVGRQTPTEGGPLDLLGVDKDGRLCVFELKRGTLSRDAVAQIIDYASDLDIKNDLELAEHIATRSGTGGIEQIENFEEWHTRNTEAESLASFRPLRLFLVGLGVDDRTERMVRFLAENSDMEITLLTFHGFAHEGNTFLAKQVEVEPVAAQTHSPRRYNRSVGALEARAQNVGAYGLLAAVKSMFLGAWQRGLNQSASTRRLNFYVVERSATGGRSTPTYLSIEVGSDGIEGPGVRVCFYPRAVELCKEQFAKLEKCIPETERQPNPQAIPSSGDVNYEVLVPMRTLSDWENHKERLTSLTQSVYTAWEECQKSNGVA